jgi:uncharacterized cupredoxin-like copper-binding protein
VAGVVNHRLFWHIALVVSGEQKKSTSLEAPMSTQPVGEAIDAATTSAAAAATDLVAEISHRLDQFESVVAELTDRIAARYSAAEARIGELHEWVKTTGATFRNTVDTATTRIAGSREDVERRTTELVGRFGEAASALDKLAELVRGARQEFNDELDKLPEKLRQLEQATTVSLTSLEAEGAKMRADVDAAQQKAGNTVDGLEAASGKLLREFEERFRASGLRIREVMAFSDEQHASVRESTVATGTVVNSAFADATDLAVRTFGDDAASVRDKLNDLGGKAFQLKEDYDRRIERVLGAAKEVVALVRQIRPVLDLVRKLA